MTRFQMGGIIIIEQVVLLSQQMDLKSHFRELMAKSPYLLWKERKGQELAGHGESVFDLVYSPNQEILASTGEDKGDFTIKLWNTTNGVLIRMIPIDVRELKHLAFSPDGSLLAGNLHGNTIGIWFVEDGSLLMK